MKELLEPYTIKVIKISEKSKVHIPGLVEDLKKLYGHFEIQDGKIVLIRKK